MQGTYKSAKKALGSGSVAKLENIRYYCFKMSSLDQILEPIIHSPRLTEVVDALQQKLAEEQLKRQQFYQEMTPSQKVEFIDGEVVFHSPAKNRHLDATGLLFTLMRVFVDTNKLGTVKTEKCLCTFPRNDYEPDIVFFDSTKAKQFSEDTLQFPIPDLIVEVLSSSTEKNDRGVKFEDYEANGVQEYWIINTEEKTVEIYQPDAQQQFACVQKASNKENVSSTAINGFTISVAAIFDETENLSELSKLIG